MAQAKYEKWLESDNLILLEGWARDGLSREQIAHNMGINRKTLAEWEKKYTPISNTLKKGREVVDLEVENALLKRALGCKQKKKVTIEKITEKGKEIETKTEEIELPGDTTAQIFWLKNRRPDKWKDRPKSDIDTMEQEVRIEQMKTVIEDIKSKQRTDDEDDGVIIVNDV